MDEPDEYIDFMAKYKDWISIKRLGIREATKPEEVVHHMAAIRGTIDSKSYLLLGIKSSILDQQAKNICAGSRKSYESLAAALSKMNSSETKKVISEACSKELAPLAETYLLGKILTTIGYDASINQAQMSKIFPYLKTPKPLGRGKKAAEA